MKTNELIYKEISESGVITEANMKLLKNRSNKAGSDLFDYDFLESFLDGCGIPLTVDQGEKGLLWLKKFIRKNFSKEHYPSSYVRKYYWRNGIITNSCLNQSGLLCIYYKRE